MAIQKNANLDISVAAEQNPNYNMKPSVQFSTQDRNTAKYTFTVKQDNKAVDLTDVTATVTLYMADKSIFQNNATVTNAKEGEIEYTIPPDAIRHHGSAKGELKLTYANGDALGGLRFSFTIEQSLIDKADGELKEVYIEDFQTISNAVSKKAEEVTINLERLDEEYQNKAYTVDEKLADVQATVNDLRENGTGIDAQARQEVEQVGAQLGVSIGYRSFSETDDTGRIQRAIDKLSTTDGGTILFPNGKTFITDSLEVDKKKVCFYSLGRTILKLKDNANKSLLWVKTGADEFQAYGIEFDGNKDNQTHTVKVNTPYSTNSALVQIQSHRPFLSNCIVRNTKLRGFMVGGYTDSSTMIDKPHLIGCKTFDTGDVGIYAVFAKQPLIQGCFVSKVGGDFIKITSIDEGTKTISTEKPFFHLRNTKIGIFKIGTGSNADRPKFIGSLTKGTNPNNVSSFVVPDLTLWGGAGSLTYSNDLYLLSAESNGNGIIASNCDSAKIESSHAEFTSLMGIGIIQDRGSNAIINGCSAKNVGEEGLALDGCRGGKIIGGTTDGCSINSNAPDIHIANYSPGLSDPKANSIIGCTSYNGLSTHLINAGLNGGNVPDNSLVSSNIVYRNPDFNWDDNAVGIQITGVSTVMGNNIYFVKNGIRTIGSDTPKVKANIVVGIDSAGSIGIRSNNSARIIISNNDIQKFESAVSVDSQGAYKISGNNINYCTYALDTSLTGADTAFVGNTTYSTNLFKSAIPLVVHDVVFNYFKSKNDMSLARTVYSSPVTFTPPTNGFLKVVADGGYSFPSEKIYRVWKWNNGTVKFLISPISVTEVDPAIISSTTTIDGTNGLITISVTGTGGAKNLQYKFSQNLLNL